MYFALKSRYRIILFSFAIFEGSFFFLDLCVFMGICLSICHLRMGVRGAHIERRIP